MQFGSCFRLACCFAVLATSAPQSLREAAKASGMLIGTAVRPALLSDASYSATLAHEFNMLEPEDAMKWRVVGPTADSFDFAPGDLILRCAGTYGIHVRSHCLVWDRYHPKWLADGHFTPAQLSNLLQVHVATEMKHYAGQVFAWDVVNEALDEKGRREGFDLVQQAGHWSIRQGDSVH